MICQYVCFLSLKNKRIEIVVRIRVKRYLTVKIYQLNFKVVKNWGFGRLAQCKNQQKQVKRVKANKAMNKSTFALYLHLYLSNLFDNTS